MPPELASVPVALPDPNSLLPPPSVLREQLAKSLQATALLRRLLRLSEQQAIYRQKGERAQATRQEPAHANR